MEEKITEPRNCPETETQQGRPAPNISAFPKGNKSACKALRDSVEVFNKFRFKSLGFLVKLATLVIGFLFSVSCTQKSRYFCQFWKAWKSYRFYMTLSKCIWVNCSLKSNIMDIFFQWFVSLCQEREISKPHQCQKGRNAGGKCQHRYLKTLKKPAASLKVKQSKPDASENTGIDILREEILSPETQSLETVIGWRNWMRAVDVEEKNTISQSGQEPNAHLTPVYMNGGCWETINGARHPEI